MAYLCKIKCQIVKCMLLTLTWTTLFRLISNKTEMYTQVHGSVHQHYDITLYRKLWLYLWSLCFTSWQSRQVSWSQVSQNSFSGSCLWMSQNIGLWGDTPWTSGKQQKDHCLDLHLRYKTISVPSTAWILYIKWMVLEVRIVHFDVFTL